MNQVAPKTPNTFPHNFKVVDSVAASYIYVWETRRSWIQYALIVFLIKCGCGAIVLLTHMEDQTLRSALINTPAYFAEGLLAAYIIGRIVIDKTKQGDLLNVLSLNTLKSTAIVYTLIQLTFGLIVFVTSSEYVKPYIMPSTPDDVSMGRFLTGLISLFVVIWALRLTWLYVPYAMGTGAKRYLRSFKSYSASLYMIGVALMCSVPIGIVLMIFLQMIIPADTQVMSDLPLLTRIVMNILQAISEVSYAMLVSAAMTCAAAPSLIQKSLIDTK